MPCSNDRNYHESRAQEELKRAKECRDPGVASLHRELAALHRRRMIEIVYLGEPQIDPAPLVGGRPLQHDAN